MAALQAAAPYIESTRRSNTQQQQQQLSIAQQAAGSFEACTRVCTQAAALQQEHVAYLCHRAGALRLTLAGRSAHDNITPPCLCSRSGGGIMKCVCISLELYGAISCHSGRRHARSSRCRGCLRIGRLAARLNSPTPLVRHILNGPGHELRIRALGGGHRVRVA